MNCGRVAILGWTNVGKSTLLNRLIGEKIAAVAEVSQTTRYRITGVWTSPGRGQIVFVDTPGFHRPRFRMNRAMVRAARDALFGVEVLLQVIDAARGIGPGDREIVDLLRRVEAPRVAALNKVDRVRPKSQLLPMLQTVVQDLGFREGIPISALTGDGCDALIDCLLRLLPEGPAPYPEDFLTDQSERELVAEFVREKLLERTREELPHSIAVMVERWAEDPRGLLRITVGILVDRESQKAIVIGKDGEVLKRAGTEARRDLEELLGRRLYLELWVKVRKHWRDDDVILHQLGIE